MQITATDVLNFGLSLSPADRELIAHRLWESLPDPNDGGQDLPEILEEADRRDAEMESGVDVGSSHEEVMAAARRALRCEWFTIGWPRRK